jgi:serine/threonine protein kinase
LDLNDVVLVLGDFGVAGIQSNHLTSGPIGTIGWMAPELYADDKYNRKVDVSFTLLDQV